MRFINPSIPSPMAMLPAATPRWRASAALSSKLSGSPYFHVSGAAARSAAITAGEGPNALSLAPTRARIGMPVWRSMASGPTNGTVSGSCDAMAVSGGLDMEMRS